MMSGTRFLCLFGGLAQKHRKHRHVQLILLHHEKSDWVHDFNLLRGEVSRAKHNVVSRGLP
jgi:hypothetical protein